ncbi:MAG: hypothetical protein ACREPQ_00615 [Rhodanobacter sp.]
MTHDGLYSALEASLQAAKGAPKAAAAALWRQWLDGAQRRGEFREAERLWVGLDAWLERQPAEIRREAVQAFARSQHLKLEVIVKGEPIVGDVELPEGWRVDHDPDGLWRIRRPSGQLESVGVALSDALRGVPGLATTRDTFAGAPHYGDYVLPGGTGYREVLVCLPRPATPEDTPVAEHVREAFRDAWDAMQQRRSQAFGTPDYPAVLAEEAQLYARMRDQTLVDQGGWQGSFGRSHFDEENVLVHLRLNQRVDALGRRVLFVEEVQSDWHQAGRAFGYRPSNPYQVLAGTDGALLAGPFATRPQADTVAERLRKDGQSAMVDPPTWADQASNGSVPDAPFKATADWATLAFKQALRMAVQSDCEAIAWANGTLQTERYDLSGQVEAIQWAHRPQGVYDVEAEQVHGGMVNRRGLNESALVALVGKEVAGKIVDGVGLQHDVRGYRHGRLEKLDLRLQGDGLRTFYDGILPQAVARYVKPMGGTLATLDMPVSAARGKPEAVASVQGLAITPAMRESVLSGQPMFRRPAVAGGSMLPLATGMTVDAVAEVAREFLASYRQGLKTVGVRIGQTLEDLYGPGATEALGSTTAGAYHPARGLLTVAANRMPDRACIEATLRHELLGHYGLNTFLPEDKRAILDAILASRSAPGMKPLWDAVDRRYADRDQDTRAEEVFALVAEQPRGPGAQLWDHLLALINKGLRAVRLADGETSKAELRVLAQSIAKGIREGQRPQQNFPASDDALFLRPATPDAESIRFLMAKSRGTPAPQAEPTHDSEPPASPCP